MSQEAFNRGFVKAAQEIGLTQWQANELYKQAVADLSIPEDTKLQDWFTSDRYKEQLRMVKENPVLENSRKEFDKVLLAAPSKGILAKYRYKKKLQQAAENHSYAHRMVEPTLFKR